MKNLIAAEIELVAGGEGGEGEGTDKEGKNVLLSSRELAIFEILIRNRGNMVSKSLIEEHVYDWSSEDVESNTIEVHISALRKKLGKELIKTVRNLGYTIAG